MIPLSLKDRLGYGQKQWPQRSLLVLDDDTTVMKDENGREYIALHEAANFAVQDLKGGLDSTRYIVRCVFRQPSSPPFSYADPCVPTCSYPRTSRAVYHQTGVSPRSAPWFSYNSTGVHTQPNSFVSSPTPSPLPLQAKRGPSHL